MVNFIVGISLTVFFLIWIVRSLINGSFNPTVLTATTCALIGIVDPDKLVGLANLSERFIYAAIAIAILNSNYGILWRRISGVILISLPLYLVYLASEIPKAGLNTANLEHTAINDPNLRYKLLFWHRPYLFLDQVELAQKSALTGVMPTNGGIYTTSILYEKPNI